MFFFVLSEICVDCSSRFTIPPPSTSSGSQLNEANSLPRNILQGGFSWPDPDDFEDSLERVFNFPNAKPNLNSTERDAVDAKLDNICFDRQHEIVKAKYAEEQHHERLENLKELLQEESGNDWILESKLDTISLGKAVMSSTCFVTVGTTRFDALTNEILSERTLVALKKLGMTTVVAQIGAGEFEKKRFEEVFGPACDHDSGSTTFAGLRIEFYRYKPSIAEDLTKAKFVISHAGAGTVLECMRLNKPLLVVINELLMDNHQVELAAKLADLDHVLYCVPSDLAQTIVDSRLFGLRPFVAPDMAKVAKHIDGLMGVTI